MERVGRVAPGARELFVIDGLESESFSHLEETLEKAQGLMAKVIEQNKHWPGGEAFEEDIINRRQMP